LLTEARNGSIRCSNFSLANINRAAPSGARKAPTAPGGELTNLGLRAGKFWVHCPSTDEFPPSGEYMSANATPKDRTETVV
jgi:hypothetical protein